MAITATPTKNAVHLQTHPNAEHSFTGTSVVLGASGGVASEIDFAEAATATTIPIRQATGQLTVSPTPSADSDAASKGYVDAAIEGMTVKDPVVVMGASNLALLGEQTIDGVLTSTSRVLLTGQTIASENGIWVTGAGAWSRPVDFATGSSASGAFVWVDQGTTYQDTSWVCTSNIGSDVVDTNNLAFSGASAIIKFAYAGASPTYAEINGAGLTAVGNAGIAYKTASSSFLVFRDSIGAGTLADMLAVEMTRMA